MHYTNAGAALVADIIAAQLTPFLAQKFPEYYQGSTYADASHPLIFDCFCIPTYKSVASASCRCGAGWSAH